MYKGEKPYKIKNNSSVWSTFFGCGCTNKKNMVTGGTFVLNKHIKLDIQAGLLSIVVSDNTPYKSIFRSDLAEGKTRFDVIDCPCDKKLIKFLKKENIIDILNTEIPNCVYWDYFRRTAFELYTKAYNTCIEILT